MSYIMAFKRKLVRQHKSIVCVIPKALVDILGLDVGDELLFKLADENKRLMIEPVLAFDARIQQKLKDFGLIQSSRNKTRQMIKDFGLNQSSHNKNEIVIDNDKIKEGD